MMLYSVLEHDTLAGVTALQVYIPVQYLCLLLGLDSSEQEGV